MDLLFRNCIIHKVNPIFGLRGGIICQKTIVRTSLFQHKPDFMETLLFKKHYPPIQKMNPIVLLRGFIFGIFKRLLLRFPALCQHKPDMMETLLFQNVILLFKTLILLFAMNNDTIVQTSCVT